MTEQVEKKKESLFDFFVINEKGTAIDWKATKKLVHKWHRDNTSGSTAADALNAGENIRKMKATVRKFTSKEIIKYLQKERQGKS